MMSGRNSALAGAVILLALNLRTVIASLPPLLAEVRVDLGLSATAAGLLTTLPVVCFGAFAPVVPRLARRMSLERILTVCAIVTAVAAGLRGAGTASALFGASLLAGCAAAVAQGALPILIRLRWTKETGRLTGAYSMALPLGATLAAATAVPLEHALGDSWSRSLVFWVIPAALAAVVWPVVSRGPGTKISGPVPTPLRMDPLAWAVAAYFGVQSAGFYAGLAWIPEILESHGYSDSAAGGLQAVNSLAMAPEVALLWVALIGLGQGGMLGVGLILPVLRARTPQGVASLTAMTLCAGYLIASTGPWILGVLHDRTGSWTAPLVALLVIIVLQLIPGVPACRDRTLR
jgi:CP family cyanate transporter-like MFS transporter